LLRETGNERRQASPLRFATEQQSRTTSAFLFLFPGGEGWLPRDILSAWRRGNYLDLIFLGFLGLPIPSLLAFCHVGLPWLKAAQIAEFAEVRCQ
jgi:hypothetical protein